MRNRATPISQPHGPADIDPYYLAKSPVLIASAANRFTNEVNGVPAGFGVGTGAQTTTFAGTPVGIAAAGSAAATTSSILFEDYPFGGTTPITVIAFMEALPGANRSYVAQATEVILRTSAAGTGVEFILNSFATNDRVTVTPDTRSSPGFFAAGTYGPSGKLRAYGNTAVAEVTPTGTYANNADVFSAIYTAGLNVLLDRRLALLAIFRSEFSREELADLCRNPWRLYRPRDRRIYVDFGAGGGAAVSLVVADAAHSQAAESLVLTSATDLATSSAAHAQAADNVTLATTAAVDLTVADASHAQSADALTLTSTTGLAVADSAHAQAADSVVLSAAEALTVSNAAHAQSAENATLTIGGIGLSVADAAHAQSAGSLTLSSASFLITADASHGHTADLLTLSTATFFAIDGASHAQTADNLSLDGAPVLGVSNSLHGQIAESVALTMDSWLAAANAAHAHTAQNVTLDGGGLSPAVRGSLVGRTNMQIAPAVRTNIQTSKR